MTSTADEHVFEELQKVIDETQIAFKCFIELVMDSYMPGNYEKLVTVPDDVVKQQREHKLAMLTGDSTAEPTTER